MRSPDDSRRFPSGRTVADCRKDAKRLALTVGISLAEALRRIAIANGSAQGWDRAAAVLAPPSVRPAGAAWAMGIEEVRAVLAREPMLTRFGFGASREAVASAGSYGAALARGQQELLANWEECNRAARFLAHVEVRKTINPRVGTSYGLKHAAQFYISRVAVDRPANPYISNGAFICAAVHAGFDMKPGSDGSPNVIFNISSRSPVLEWRRIAERPSYGDPALAARQQRLNEVVGVGAK